DGTAERLAREPRDDPLRARQLLGLALGIAGEDPATAFRRLGEPGRPVRPDDLDAEHARHVRHPFAGNHRVQVVIRLREASRDERRADLAIAGLHRKAKIAETVLDLADGFDLTLVDGTQIVLAAELALEHLLAVDRQDDLVPILEPALRIRAQLRTRHRRDI